MKASFSSFTFLFSALVAAQSTTNTAVGSVPTGVDSAETPAFGNYSIIDIFVPPSGNIINGEICNVSYPAVRRTVAYTVSERGNAIIDGDIIFGTEAELLAAAVQPLQKRAFSLTPTSSRKWPNGIVYYKWEAGLAQRYKDFFLEGAKQWTDRLPWLQFIESNTNPSSRLIVASTTGNSSPVGCCGGTMELCPECNSRSARHEIGHTLGLEHEHQRPDRDSYISIVCPGGTCSNVVNFNVAKSDGTNRNWAGSYDLNSVMHYAPSGSINGDTFQIVPKGGVSFTSAARFPSPVDTSRVCNLYWESCHSICGDGILTPGTEECDDGNNANGDSCSSSCRIEAPPAPVCVPSCSVFNQPLQCGLRASCTVFNPVPSQPKSGQSFCMCQAGYRGAGLDFSGTDQYRVTWSNAAGGQTHRVMVKPGQDCSELCSDVNCSQVPLKDTCR